MEGSGSKRSAQNADQSSQEDSSKRLTKLTVGSGGGGDDSPLPEPDEFKYIGEFGQDLHGHVLHCRDYQQGDRQRMHGNGCCCPRLTGGTNMVPRMIENSCCGTSVRMLLERDGKESLPIGYLDCHYVAFLAPLVKAGAIKVSAHIGCLVHPIGGLPPMMVRIEGKLGWMEDHKADPEFGPLIRSIVLELGKSSSDWIEDFEIDEQAVERLRIPEGGPDIKPRKCTCTQSSCFLIEAYESGKKANFGEGYDDEFSDDEGDLW